jgi:hypothetical protein
VTDRLRRAALAAALLGLVLLAVWFVRDRVAGRSMVPGLSPGARAPEGVRVKVEVLNATRVRGLARRATILLRDRGFDVVDVGTSANLSDSTLVLDRSGHPDWARRVADALGGARVESRPDSSRYLDATVILGATWRPPAQPFNP